MPPLHILAHTILTPEQTKPNVGHSEAASGLSSLMKVVLALEKGEIPPNTNYKTPNPKSMSLSVICPLYFDD
jgi:3-oxoacyl-(acyl-carrier-protein) synthase